MDLATTLAIIGAGGTAAAALFGGWQAYEIRRQRKIADASAVAEKDPSPRVGSVRRTWLCGIYDYQPLSAYPAGQGAEPSGILVDLVSEIMNKLGQPIRFTRFNYGGFYENDDRIPDLIVGMFETNRRRTKVRFSRPLYEIGLQGVCLTDLDGDVLEGIRDGALRGAVYAGEVGWEFAVDELPDAMEQERIAVLGGVRTRDTMSLLTQGGYDVVLMDALSCTNFLREDGHGGKFRLAFDHPLQTFDSCLAVKPEHVDELAAIDVEVSRVRNTSWYLEREATALSGFEKIVHRRGLKRT